MQGRENKDAAAAKSTVLTARDVNQIHTLTPCTTRQWTKKQWAAVSKGGGLVWARILVGSGLCSLTEKTL